MSLGNRRKPWHPDWRVLALGLFGCFALTAAFMPAPPKPSVVVIAELEPAPSIPTTTVVENSILPEVPEVPEVHPLAGLTDSDIGRLLREDITQLGSFSVGRPSRGLLFNAVQMPGDPAWKLTEPAKSWGTRETVELVSTLIRRVALRFEATPPLWVGNISGRKGGYLKPHRSHQSGRDIDLGFYYLGEQKWYRPATAKNLDTERTWALVTEFLETERVEYIFIDRGVQRLLQEYATKAGADAAWLKRVFHGESGARNALIRHASGHQTHMHVRLLDDVARESGLRAYPQLLRAGKIPKRSYYLSRHDRQTTYSAPEDLRTARR